MSNNENHHEQVKKVEYDTTPTLALGVFGAFIVITIIGSVGFVWWLVNWQGSKLIEARSSLQRRVILGSTGKLLRPYEQRKLQKLLVANGGTDRYQEAGVWKTEKVQPIKVAMNYLLTHKNYLVALPSSKKPVAPPVRRVVVKSTTVRKKPAAQRRVVPVRKPVAPVIKKSPVSRKAAPVQKKSEASTQKKVKALKPTSQPVQVAPPVKKTTQVKKPTAR